jgi:hypothetical protein
MFSFLFRDIQIWVSDVRKILKTPWRKIRFKKKLEAKKKSGSERFKQIYSSFRKLYLFEWKRKLLGCETFSSFWPLFPTIFDQIWTFNIPFYWKFNAEFKSLYRIRFAFQVLKILQFWSARSVKISWKTQDSKMAHRPEIVM